MPDGGEGRDKASRGEGRIEVEGKIWGGPPEMRWGGGCHRYSAADLRMQLRDWTWRDEGRGEVLQFTYLLPWQARPVRSQRVSAGAGAEKNQQVGKGSSNGKICVIL